MSPKQKDTKGVGRGGLLHETCVLDSLQEGQVDTACSMMSSFQAMDGQKFASGSFQITKKSCSSDQTPLSEKE